MLKETLNHDIAGIVKRQVRYVNEALKCQSANGLDVMVHDIARMESYLAAADTYKAHVMTDPLLDLPETHPTSLNVEIPEISVVESIENEAISDWCRLMLLSALELINSQSSRQSSSLNTHDSNRYDMISAKTRNLMENYIKPIQPIDAPETIPSVASITSGSTGI